MEKSPFAKYGYWDGVGGGVGWGGGGGGGGVNRSLQALTVKIEHNFLA